MINFRIVLSLLFLLGVQETQAMQPKAKKIKITIVNLTGSAGEIKRPIHDLTVKPSKIPEPEKIQHGSTLEIECPRENSYLRFEFKNYESGKIPTKELFDGDIIMFSRFGKNDFKVGITHTQEVAESERKKEKNPNA